jgi:hypothetical protein
MHARYLSAVLGIGTLFCLACPTARACHFRVRHHSYYEYGSHVGYYGPAQIEPLRGTVDSPASTSGVVPAAHRTSEPEFPATVAPVHPSTPRVMHLSELGNNNFPDD